MIIACIRSIKQGKRERERKIDKYSCRKTQGLRSFTCLSIRHVNRYSTMIHGKLCHARVRYINFLNVPCIRKKTCEPGKIIPLSGNQCCLPPLIYLNRRNPEYHTSYLSLTILIRVAHDSLNREKFIKLILTREIVHRPYIPNTIPFIHWIHSKRIIWKFGTHYFPSNPNVPI